MNDRLPNPLSEEPLSEGHSNQVRDYRTIRRGTRRAMRSGNPAVRAEAARVNAAVPKIIRAIYEQQARADALAEEAPHLMTMGEALE